MKKEIKIKKELIYIIITPIFIAVACYLFILSNKTEKLEILYYTKASNIDYLVCLKENNFYMEECQPKGMGYIASAIDNIDVVFDYKFKTRNNVNYTYEYYVDSIITVFDRNDLSNILFNKVVKILGTDIKKVNNSNEYNINEKLTINYQEHNELVKAFKSEYNISAYSSLTLKLYIKTMISYEKFTDVMETNDVMELTIPLTENTININMNYNEINTSDKFVRSPKKSILNKLYLYLSIIFSVLGVVSTILFVITFNKKKVSKNKYERFINSKLKNLDRMIVSAMDEVMINETDYLEVIDVKSFSELVDIAERLVDVITWTELTNKEEKVSWFTISSGKRLYRIIYKSNDKVFK